MFKSCATCSFHVGAGKETYCRFNPPIVSPVFRMNPIGGQPQLSGQVSLFPKVETTWWCGQYEMAADIDVANHAELGTEN